MKKIVFTLLMSCSAIVFAQSKQTRIILSNSASLQTAVFETKDSAMLESLFAKGLSYEHSNGKVQSREEAIQGIIHNQSVYIISVIPAPYDVLMQGDSAKVKKVFKAVEKKSDGTEVNLDLTITLVWIKENGKWKLIRRKAVKN